MSRYRPPRTAGTALITPEGEARLRAELHELWHVRRPQVTQSVSEAAAQGDRSENAEYIYRKKELRELDRRIRYLQIRLPALKVVNSIPSNTQQVFFGASVHLQNAQGEISVYRIVGPDEFDQQPHYISMDSPLARALLKRELGEEVMVQTPAGEQLYLIAEIEYS